jgi:hypothetical protein
MFARSKRERKGRKERKGTQSSARRTSAISAGRYRRDAAACGAREYLHTATAVVSPCVAEGSHRQQPPSLRFFAVFALFAFEL